MSAPPVPPRSSLDGQYADGDCFVPALPPRSPRGTVDAVPVLPPRTHSADVSAHHKNADGVNDAVHKRHSTPDDRVLPSRELKSSKSLIVDFTSKGSPPVMPRSSSVGKKPRPRPRPHTFEKAKTISNAPPRPESKPTDRSLSRESNVKGTVLPRLNLKLSVSNIDEPPELPKTPKPSHDLTCDYTIPLTPKPSSMDISKELSTSVDSDFEQICFLGKGAFSVVNKVLHTPSDRIMAVKELNDPSSSAEGDAKAARDAVTQLEAEINSLAGSTNCAFIVQYFGLCFRSARVLIYMEALVASLETCYLLLKDQSTIFPEVVLKHIAISVLQGMVYLKTELNVMHRDIKPQNILLGTYGEVKISDLGLAKAMGSGSFAKTQGIGTRIYKAPERIDGSSNEGYGTEADVWSYGISMVELGQLQYPFGNLTEFQIMTAVVEGSPPGLPELYSKELRAFLDTCLEPKQRRPRLDKPAPDKPENIALNTTPFYLENSIRDFQDARDWLVHNVVSQIEFRVDHSISSE